MRGKLFAMHFCKSGCHRRHRAAVRGLILFPQFHLRLISQQWSSSPNLPLIVHDEVQQASMGYSYKVQYHRGTLPLHGDPPTVQ